MKWRPSKKAKRDFAIKMQTDPIFAAEYELRKLRRADRRRSNSAFDYKTAGGYYVATKSQYDFCVENMTTFNKEQTEAANQIIYSYSCQEKIHHDYIHIINKRIRNEH